MALPALLDDAVRADEHGFFLRLALPWIRSLPVSSVTELSLTVDDRAISPLFVVIGNRSVTPVELARERGWWFLQDRLVLAGRDALSPKPHRVRVSFQLVIPYLRFGADGVLALPFEFESLLDPESASPERSVARDVA